MRTLLLKGKIFSGKGEGAKFIRFPWVRNQIKEKLGFPPYLGTLNIRLTEKSLKLKNLLKNAEGMEITPVEGFHRGKCFKAYLMGLECAVVIPEVQGYPEDMLEVVASTNLRKKLQFKDGDMVEVKVLIT